MQNKLKIVDIKLKTLYVQREFIVSKITNIKHSSSIKYVE